MGLFRKIRENRRIRDLEEGQESLERHLRGLRADMDLQWEKIQRLFARISKRSAMLERAQQEEEAEAGQSSPEEASSDEPFMTPRQRQINEAILASRRRQ